MEKVGTKFLEPKIRVDFIALSARRMECCHWDENGNIAVI